MMTSFEKETKYVELEGIIKHETAAAVLFSIDDYIKGVVDYWFPTSQISKIVRANPEKKIFTDKVHVAQWLAEKKGLV